MRDKGFDASSPAKKNAARAMTAFFYAECIATNDARLKP